MLLNCGAGEDSWESLGLQGVKAVYPKGDQSWVFIGRTDAEAETVILWLPHAKKWLTGKDPDAGKDWRQEEKRTKGDEMVGWHHWLDGHEFEQTPGVGDGQGNLACCGPWGRKESGTTKRLNWTELIYTVKYFSRVALSWLSGDRLISSSQSVFQNDSVHIRSIDDWIFL